MNVRQARAHIRRFGSDDERFIANTLGGYHTNPTRKIIGLAALMLAGCEIRAGQFAMDVLIIDGKRQPWAVLKNWRDYLKQR